MTLGEKQELFAHLLGRLLVHAFENGFHVRVGEVERPKWVAEEYARQGKGIANSVHTIKLAVDLHLFDHYGTYLRHTDDHAQLGAWWEAQHPLCRWGGRFGDGNHYSLEHEGRQ